MTAAAEPIPNSDATRSPISRALGRATVGDRWLLGTLVGYLITRLVASAASFTAARNPIVWPPEFEQGELSGWELMTSA